MATGQLGAVFRQFNRLFGAGSVSGLSEGQLLARFVESRDDAAFEAIVTRFGPMVMGICRQVLNDSHAADDAFQATFLVLVRRARTIRDRELLGNWLYGAALKVARRARADQAKQRSREAEVRSVKTEFDGDSTSPTDQEFAPALHEEISRLADKYRRPMVLCFLEGHTCEEAADRLGWPVGTVKGRISRAKDLLRGRLARRGIVATSTLISTTLTRAAEASISPVILDQTVKAAMGLAAGGTAVAAGVFSATAVALADGVESTMFLSNLKVLAATAAIVASIATGAGVMARQGIGPGHAQDTAKAGSVLIGRDDASHSESKSTTPSHPMTVESIISSTPLPKEIEATPEVLANRVKAAKQELEIKFAFFENGSITIDRVVKSSTDYLGARVAEVQRDPAKSKLATEEHVRLLQNLLNREELKYKAGQGSLPNVAEAASALLDAKLMLAHARSESKSGDPRGKPISTERGNLPVATKVDPAGEEIASDDPEGDTKINKVLQQVVSMTFSAETPLEDALKYIATATSGTDFATGLPIYVDPQSLEEAGKTIASPIKLSLEGIKLKTSLRLLLKQVGMGYYVKHGLVIVASLDDDELKDANQPGWRQRLSSPDGGGGFGGGNAGMMGGGGGGFR